MNIATANRRCRGLMAFIATLIITSTLALPSRGYAQTFSVTPNSENTAVLFETLLGVELHKTFTVTNHTALPITVLALLEADANSGLSLPGLGLVVVGANASADLDVLFLPTADVDANARLVLFNLLDTVSVDIIARVGKQFDVNPHPSIGAAVEFFAEVGARDTQNFVISNNHTAGITVNAAITGTGASAFSLSSSSASISAEGSSTIHAYYTPTAAGTHTATLRLTYGADTILIALIGTATSPGGGITITPNSQSGSPVTLTVPAGQTISQTFTASNQGNSSVTVNANLTGSPTFSFAPNSFTIGPNATGTLTVTFAPMAVGTYNAALSLSSGNENASVQIVGIATGASGNITLNPSRTLVEFNNTLVGVQVCETIRITNPTDATVTITEASIINLSGSGNQFAITHGANIQIPAGGTDSVVVCYTASQPGESLIANLRLHYSASNDRTGITMIRLEGNSEPVTEALNLNLVVDLAFDALHGETECQTIRVTNPSPNVTALLAMNMANNNAGFALNGSSQLTLQPLQTGLITICYTGDNLRGPTNTTLDIVVLNTEGNTFLGSYQVNVRGTTERDIDQDLTDTIIIGDCFRAHQTGGIFGPIVRGATTEEVVLIENRTNSAMTIAGASIMENGQSSTNFSMLTPSQLTVQPFSTVALRFRFSPKDSTRISYTANVRLDVQGSQCSDLAFDLYGVGLQPAVSGGGVVDTLGLVVNVGGHLNGNVIVLSGLCNAGSQAVAIQNTLLVPVTITGMTLSGLNAANFTILGSAPTLPATLLPGEMITLQVRFDCGDTTGLYKANLNVTILDAIQVQVFVIQVSQLPQASINEVESGVAINISPNPTRGVVRIEATDAVSARIEILNLLGQVVASGEGTSFTWNSKEGTSAVSAGVYFVRITGTNAEGVDFIETRQIVVE